MRAQCHQTRRGEQRKKTRVGEARSLLKPQMDFKLEIESSRGLSLSEWKGGTLKLSPVSHCGPLSRPDNWGHNERSLMSLCSALIPVVLWSELTYPPIRTSPSAWLVPVRLPPSPYVRMAVSKRFASVGYLRVASVSHTGHHRRLSLPPPPPSSSSSL